MRRQGIHLSVITALLPRFLLARPWCTEHATFAGAEGACSTRCGPGRRRFHRFFLDGLVNYVRQPENLFHSYKNTAFAYNRSTYKPIQFILCNKDPESATPVTGWCTAMHSAPHQGICCTRCLRCVKDASITYMRQQQVMIPAHVTENIFNMLGQGREAAQR
jgi:hypothetical protein